jgi:hypothetical protein
MRQTVSRAIALAAVGALLLAAAACGGGGNKSAAQTQAAATTTQETATTDTTATEPATTQTDTSAPDFASAANCREFAALGAKVSQALGGAGGSNIQNTKQLMNEFADKAPGEIRDDFKVIADAYGKIADALKDVNLKPGAQPSAEAIAKLQKLGQEIDQPRLQKANTNITAWVQKNCGGTVTTG